MDLTGKVALITGASEGIGRAAAIALSSRGARVVMAARNIEALEALERELEGSLAIAADIRRDSDVAHLVEKAEQHFGRIDILINNAGQAIYGKLTDVSIEDYREVIELNVIGALNVLQRVARVMRAQGTGSIINLSSGTSRLVLPGIGAYASTKSALNMLTMVAREELKADGITVSLLYPFITTTRFAENAIGERPTHARVPGRPAPHSPEFVAEKILELLKSGDAEMILSPQ